MNAGFRDERRALTAAERALLEWLLEHGTAQAREFLPQLERVRVVSVCTCGCPTIDFAMDGGESAPTGPHANLADVVGTSPEGVEVGVILHARGGELSELEVYSFGGVDGAFGLPGIETLKPF
jgi:hypothetical protein